MVAMNQIGYPATCSALGSYLWSQTVCAGLMMTCVVWLAKQALAKQTEQFPYLFTAIGILLAICVAQSISTSWVGIWCEDTSASCSSVQLCGPMVFYLVLPHHISLLRSLSPLTFVPFIMVMATIVIDPTSVHVSHRRVSGSRHDPRLDTHVASQTRARCSHSYHYR